MVHLKKALTKPKKKHLTFMLVPESESTVRSYRLPLWAPKAAFLAVVVLFALSIASFGALAAMKARYDSNSSKIKALTEINASQKNQIETLKNNSDEMQKQLNENSKLLDEVKSAVGIKSESSPVTSEKKDEKKNDAPSGTQLKENGPKLFTLLNRDVNESYNMKADIQVVRASFDSLSKQIVEQKQEIESSQKPINSKLVYLRALPSIKPVNAPITCAFGYRKNPFTSRGSEFHKGVDFGASYGTTVVATGDGIVTFAGRQAGYGKMVIISHGYNIMTCYGHNSQLLVKQGDKVKKGQPISKVGSTGRSTGAHLHYEVRINGQSVNPEKYFK